MAGGAHVLLRLREPHRPDAREEDLTGLRVVRVDGRPLTPSAVAARTVLRLVDQQIACLVGMITMILSGGRRQRLGDLAGRTAVARARHARRRDRSVAGANGSPSGPTPCCGLPAIGLFVIVPETRLLPCSDKVLAVGGEEGSCLTPDGRAWDVVNTGHTLHVPGYSARLVGTKVKEMQAGRLRISGGAAGHAGRHHGCGSRSATTVAGRSGSTSPSPAWRWPSSWLMVAPTCCHIWRGTGAPV